MTLDTLIMLAGAFVATLPFLGLPNAWDSALLFVVGVLVVAFGIVVRRRGAGMHASDEKRDAHFVEHMPHTQQEAHGQS